LAQSGSALELKLNNKVPCSTWTQWAPAASATPVKCLRLNLGFSPIQKDSPAGPFTEVVAEVTDSNWTDTGLTPETTYYYTLRILTTSGTWAGSPVMLQIVRERGPLAVRKDSRTK
jgi:hypothetical protein